VAWPDTRGAAWPNTSATDYGDKMNEELIQVVAIAARIACAAVTSPGQAALQASLDQACGIPAGFGWERKAAAHAEFFTTLADAADDPCASPVLNHGAGFAYDLMIGAGSAADGMVINSRRRMLDYLRAGHPDQAAFEMEKHLQILRFMNRLATSPARPSAAAAPLIERLGKSIA
jgi:DNA-binding GntR family transcriptional regulator